MINPRTILAYSESAVVFGQPAENNLRLAILNMPPGSVMVAWQGTRPGRLGTLLTVRGEVPAARSVELSGTL